MMTPERLAELKAALAQRTEEVYAHPYEGGYMELCLLGARVRRAEKELARAVVAGAPVVAV